MIRRPRKSVRKKAGTAAWIRPDEGFSVRRCTILDRTDEGVKLAVDTPQTVASRFLLLTSRESRSGQRCRVRWRRGSQLGAEFLKAE